MQSSLNQTNENQGCANCAQPNLSLVNQSNLEHPNLPNALAGFKFIEIIERR